MEHDGAFESWRDERPWDEFEWEAFLCEQDQRVERYTELEAHYRGLPDAEARIAREMGWALPACADGDVAECGECAERFACEWRDDAGGPPDASDGSSDEHDGAAAPAYESDPLWLRAHGVAMRMHRYFGLRGGAEVHAGVPGLLTQTAMIAAKVAGGRSMGFSPEALGGNIANHKRAMCHVLASLAALEEAGASGAVPPVAAARFRRELFGLRERLMGRIVELRALFTSGQFLDE